MVRRLMSKAEYKRCLSALLVAIVRKHGEMSFQALHERANQLIITHGVDGAIDHV